MNRNRLQRVKRITIRKVLTIICCSSVGLLQAQDVIMVNSRVTGRTYEGTGALSAGASSRLLIDYPEQQRAQILDYLFKPRFGASLNHFKTEIGGDINSTCGTEPSHQHYREDQNYHRGYEWWLMKEARKRNGSILLDVLAWGAPAWIGDGVYYSADLPEYMSNYLMGMKREHGLEIDYIGIWNEMSYDTRYIKELRKTLDRYKLPVKIAAADEIRSYHICRDMFRDVELYNAIDVVGTHYPLGQGEQLYNGKTVYEQYGPDYKICWPEALNCGKPLWSLEDGPWIGDWNGAKGIIKLLVRNYIESKIVKSITWSLVSSYHDCIGIPESGLMKANTPWSGHYELKPALWAVAHLTQFADPGWIYLEGGANGYLKNGGSYTTLVSPDKQDVSLIAEAVESKGDETLRINLVGAYAGKSFHVWKSDSLNQFVKQREVLTPVDGVLTFGMEKGAIYTLTTTTGQQKGASSWDIPAAQGFPLPYADDFESYQPERLPRFTSDIAGVFEVAVDKKSGNKVLKQVVAQKGIEWAASLNPEPFTVIGDPSLTDYEVSVDVKLENKGEHAYVMGRIPGVNQGQVLPPMGYWLRLTTEGKYALCSTIGILKHCWSEFRKQWKESDAFFRNQTQNSKVFTYDELKEWPGQRIALFEGLTEVLAGEKGRNTVLVAYSNGSYHIYEQQELAAGQVSFPARKWNKVALRFQGERITASVNGKSIVDLTDKRFPKGLAGIGTGWHLGLFDNLKISN